MEITPWSQYYSDEEVKGHLGSAPLWSEADESNLCPFTEGQFVEAYGQEHHRDDSSRYGNHHG